MKKLTLDVDALRVESFLAQEQEGKRGTVGANSYYTILYHSQCAETCDDCPTKYSCNLPWNCA